jgi:multidrug efflux pump
MGGMITVTVLSLLMVPVLFVTVQRLLAGDREREREPEPSIAQK